MPFVEITNEQFLIIGVMVGGVIIASLWGIFKMIDQREELMKLRRKIEHFEDKEKANPDVLDFATHQVKIVEIEGILARTADVIKGIQDEMNLVLPGHVRRGG